MALRYPTHKISALEDYVAESTTATSGGTLALTDRTLVRLAISGNGTIDLEAGTEDGQYRIYIVETLSGTSRIENSTNVLLTNRAWLPQIAGEAIAFIWNATLAKWCELWRTENYDSTVGIYAKNNTGGTLVAGTVVYINGSVGANPLITKADYAAESTSSGTVGLVHKDIANNDFGYAIEFGTITNLKIERSPGVPGVAGDPVYLGAAGTFVVGAANEPSAPNHVVKVGIVIVGSSGNSGVLHVDLDNGWELEELHNVAISAAAKGDVLAYDSAAALWKNVAVGANDTVLTADNTVATGVKWAAPKAAIGGTITGGTAGSVLFVDPAATIAQDNPNFFWDNANNRLGINTSAPDYNITVKNSVDGVNIERGTSVPNAGAIRFGDNTGWQFHIGKSKNSPGGGLNTNATGTIATFVDTGNVGIGTTSAPAARLEVAGTFLNKPTANSVTNFQLQNAAGSVILNGDTTNSRFGILTNAPTSTLSVGASNEFQVNSTGNIVALNNITTSFPSAQGASLTRLRNNGSGTLTWSPLATVINTSTITPQTFDASLFERATWIASFGGAITAQIANLTDGREIFLYARNTNASARVLTINASTTNAGFAAVNFSRSGAVSVTNISLAATSGTATIWVANIGGNIVGAIY